MRRHLLLAVSIAILVPSAAAAQPRILVGGGITSPNGDFSNVAGTGYHVRAGIEIVIPTLPVSIRGDGDYHRLAEANPAFDRSNVLDGALSVVFTLPGVGLSPYLLGGLGQYRLESGALGLSQAVTESGFHGGFGARMGTLFVEIRYVQVNSEPGRSRYIPVTVGLRL
jgi:hypothetical protein